jgi:AmmeMemoRadiSam system protein A
MKTSEPQSEHARLARQVVESYVSGEGTSDVGVATDELKGKRAGVFVCLKKDGELRGCIGTIQPAAPNIAEEIRNNAISSATRDPRFFPVTPDELDRLTYSVDVLGDPEEIPDLSYLDPRVYGVIVKSGGKSGLLLPDLEGVDTAADQVRIAMTKAGIKSGEPVTLQRFKVTRHE